jgi:hypothetical protein
VPPGGPLIRLLSLMVRKAKMNPNFPSESPESSLNSTHVSDVLAKLLVRKHNLPVVLQSWSYYSYRTDLQAMFPTKGYRLPGAQRTKPPQEPTKAGLSKYW